jgi:hypothetical protein
MKKTVDKQSAGIRIHDIHHGLIQSSGAVVESDFAFLKELGSAAQIATTIKDHEVINEIRSLYAAAGELKIPKQITDVALKHLEVLGFVRLKWSTGKTSIERIDVTVPKYGEIYSNIGDYFLSENRSSLALASVELLQLVSKFPHKEKDVIGKLELDIQEYDIVKEVGKTASYLDTYSSRTDSESVIYTPLYWDEKPNRVSDLREKYSSSELAKSIKIIEAYQGLPGDKIKDSVLVEGIDAGCFPTLSVISSAGIKKFVFTPQQGVTSEEKTLLHKARVLLSCVRYGENFAGITKIHKPDRLLEVLAGRGYLAEHSESLKQYESARNYGLVKIIKTSGDRHEVHFIDNSENRRAVDLALQMLQLGETSKVDDSQEAAKKILLPSPLSHPTQTRIHLLREQGVKRSRATLERINDLIRGVNV